MTIKEAYIAQLKKCQTLGIRYTSGHYVTDVAFGGKSIYVSPAGEKVIRYKFNITGCMKTRVIRKNGKVVKVLHFHKDKLPVYGTITKRKGLKSFLYKYLLFLRCDGIENEELLKLYLLHCMSNKLEYWRKDKVKYENWEQYEPDYEDVEKMIGGLIQSSLKKELDAETREQFIIRSCCVVNPEVRTEYGGLQNKTNWEKCRDAKRGQRLATDNRIWAHYDKDLTDEELAQRAGVSVRRIQEWKADNRENLETLEQKITRMYDWSLSPRENADIIGCSLNTVKKYMRRMQPVPVDEETDDSWIERAVEEEYSFWKDTPDVRSKRSEEYDELMELLDDLE